MKTKFIDIEKELIRRCIQGDQKSQKQLYEHYAAAMYGVSRRIIVDEVLAEDAMQEAFITAFQKLEQFKGEVVFGAWLKSIVIRKSIDLLRKEKKLQVELENANNLNMVFKYSDAVMHRVENLALEMHYGNLNLNQVNSIVITGNYSNHVLGSVKKLLSFSGNYGTMKLDKLLAGFDELVLKCNYYNARIGIDNNASFAFVSSSNYGDVTLPNGLQLSSSNHARNSHSYVGRKGIGGGSIALSFNYGNIKFN